jgi:nucleotide-binding universal stress UspA family protein
MSGLLLCVDGSPAATAATRVALQLARDLHTQVHALFVVEDAGLAALIDEAIGDGSSERLAGSGEALRARICGMAAESGVEIEWLVDEGEPFERILERARAVRPAFIVMGRTGRRGPGRALVGSQVEHALEFTEWPVIVVPTPTGGS